MEFIRENKTIILVVMLILWAVMSLITLMLYKIDKVKAQKHQWRIKEAVLLSFPWAFGFIGAILGLSVLRHKTKHWYFVANTVLTTLQYTYYNFNVSVMCQTL